MKKMLLVFLILFTNSLTAQKAPMKWGKVSGDELQLTTVEFDSSAAAVILCDYGQMFIYPADGLTLRRHVRLKILDESAKKEANIFIPYYHEGATEKITSYNAQTINVIDGKLKKIQLSKKDFFKVKKNDKWSELRFTFPDVKAGSILEYSYTIDTEYYTSPDPWYFQNDLPTLKSHYNATIGEGLNYRTMLQGRKLHQKYSEKPTHFWELTDLPAIKEEPFCPNISDYVEKISFQLSSYLSSTGYQDFMTSWKKVTYELYEDAGLTQYLNKNKDAKEIVAGIISEGDTDEEKIKKIHKYVTNNYSWNRKYRKFPEIKYKEFKEKKTGSSAVLNLYFTNLLQAADLKASPALVSTKQHGFVSRDITFYTQFNQLVSSVILDGKDILINATNPFRPYDLLDEEDLNREALVLNKKEPYWVDIIPPANTKNIKLIAMEMPEPGILKYKYELNCKGYDAVDMREKLAEMDQNIEAYFNKRLIKENTEYQISNSTSKNIKNLDKSTYISAEIMDKTSCIVNDDYIYISPFIDRNWEQNPFNEKNRYFPVDFYRPFEETYILNFSVPEGYEVVEFPEPANVATKGKKGLMKLSSSLHDDNLQIRVNFIIKDPLFMAYEYHLLKEIFDRYIEKRAEQIVLKRKT